MADYLTNFARHLRTNSTDTEQRLWYYLRAKRFLGFQFRRQEPVGQFIVDFVCYEKRVIIELDGGHHSKQAQQDQERDNWLTQQGFTVLRFWDNEVFENIDGVLKRISEVITAAPSP